MTLNYNDLNIVTALYNKSVRVDFRVEDFERLVQQKGYKVKWEQAMYCTCYYDPEIDQYTGQPNYNCPHCKGEGFTYLDPVEIRVVATGISNGVDQTRIGLNELGTAYVTLSTNTIIGIRDRFTFVDFTIRYSQIIQLSGDKVDKLKYPPTNLIAVRTPNGSIFKPGIDCKLTPEGVEWISSPGTEGQVVSVLYQGLPRYIALGPIHELRGTYLMSKNKGMETFARLPQQFQVKREDMIE
ncbi:gp6.4 [Bacillus phage SPO1]|uniref:Gp6.4 n=1 Tax=Bacillus phage SP01 TaxID=2884427 RepID=B6V2P0_BPSP1|nr:virion structural protein [Bacillus phage SPO1]ACI90981.1 gp6.4 [Bacillus phage SPO1]